MKTTAASLERATSGTLNLHNRNRFAMPRLVPCVAAAVILLGGPSALATITPVASYDFNNNAAPAGAAAVGSPTYSNGQLVLNGSSCLSMASPTSATDNFGIEVICTPTFNDSYNYPLALNDGANNGWGILQLSGEYQGVGQNGGGFFGSAGAGSAAPNVPVHLALVRDGGVTRIYLNGLQVGTSNNLSRATPAKFTIGGNQLTTAPLFEGFFKGSIDEVRVFTFAPGAFSPATDLLKTAFLHLPTADLPAVGDSSVAWSDFDNDGRLDFLLTGSSASGPVSQLWRNTGSGFTNMWSGSTGGSAPPGVERSSVAWGDYDNDGRLDFLLTGWNGTTRVSQLWRNTGSGFTRVPISGLLGVERSSVSWGDYDNDGRLDFFLTGTTNGSSTGALSQLWRNTGSGFNNVTSSVFSPANAMVGVYNGSVTWGDYDNDGRLDFLLTGQSSGGSVSQLWRNGESGFIQMPITDLLGVSNSSVAWGDYDNDGRLDLLLTGQSSSGSVSQLWQNGESGFTQIPVTDLLGVGNSSVAWGDYDNDGRLDFLLTGTSESGIISQLWQNGISGFTQIPISGLPGVENSSVAWGDYDSDGLLDFLLTGNSGGSISQLWRNTGSGFTQVPITGLPGTRFSSLAWGDYDNDGRLDFLLTGRNGPNRVSQLWRNNTPAATTPTANTPPTAPTGLSVASSPAGLVFSWNAASDAQTPPDGLAYQLRIGTTPGGSDLLFPMTAPSGTPRLPRSIALQPARSRIITASLPTNQPIYWSVQAADNGFAASPFSADQVLRLAGVPAPTNGVVLPGDTNGDGVVSQAEFNAVRAALGTNELATQNTAGYYTPAQVQSLNVDTPLISQVSPGRFRLTLGVQKSTNLTNPFTDFSLTGPGTTTVFTDGKLEFEFPSSDNAAFFRIEAK